MLPLRPASWGTARCAQIAALVGASWLAAGAASAQEDTLDPELARDAQATRTGPVNTLPEAVAARVSDQRATASSWAGYDGAKRAPLLSVLVEGRIIGRLVFVAGAAYSADMPGAPSLRPQLGLRAQLLDQTRAGLDAAVAVTYRKDIFSNEGGFFQGAVALERRQGPAHLLANAIYGQDGEGDDLQGEARLAAFFETLPGLFVGLDSRYRHLWSTDPHQVINDRPTSEAMAGPTASYHRGSWMVMAETSVSTVRTTVTQNGLIALAGVGSSF